MNAAGKILCTTLVCANGVVQIVQPGLVDGHEEQHTHRDATQPQRTEQFPLPAVSGAAYASPWRRAAARQFLITMDGWIIELPASPVENRS
jgi:hypothetical protein